MAQQGSSSGIIAGAITILGLTLVWVTVATNFPSQEELSSAAPPAETRQAAGSPSPQSSPPTLDLTIPTSPPLPSEAAIPRPDDDQVGAQVRGGDRTVVPRLSGRFCPHALSETACQTTSAAMPKPVAGAVCEVEGRSKSIDGGV